MSDQGKEAAMSLAEQIKWVESMRDVEDKEIIDAIIATLKSLQAPVSLPPNLIDFDALQTFDWTREGMEECQRGGAYVKTSDHVLAATQLAAHVGALQRVISECRKIPTMPFPDAGAHSWQAFGTAAFRAWSDIQRKLSAAIGEGK